MKFFTPALLLLFSWVLASSSYAQGSPSVVWQQTFGGVNRENASSICLMNDGGFVVSGTTSSYDGDIPFRRDTDPNHVDILLIRADEKGKTLWKKVLGGTGDDRIEQIKPTSDGGLLLFCMSNSHDGDFVSPNAPTSQVSSWLVKIDASGNRIWQKTLQTTTLPQATYLEELSDGTYLIANSTDIPIVGIAAHLQSSNITIANITLNGGIIWQRNSRVQGINTKILRIKADKNGFWALGTTFMGNAASSGLGYTDVILLNLSFDGSLNWQKLFGGKFEDLPTDFALSADGGTIIAAQSNSFNGAASATATDTDGWVVKTDKNGTVTWQQNYGGNQPDQARSVWQTADGGFVVAGQSNSSNGTLASEGNKGNSDVWLMKLTAKGCLVWQKTLGGSQDDAGVSITQTKDTGFLVAGNTLSQNGDVLSNHGVVDFWVLRLSADIPVPKAKMEVSPKPLCEGTSTQLNATVGNLFEYQWFLNQQVIPNFNTAIYTTTQAGKYEVKALRNGCEMTDSTFSISFQPIPNAINLAHQKAICSHDFLVIPVQNQVTYQWSSGETVPKIQPQKAGKYVLTATLAGCQRKDSVEISFLSSPQIPLKEQMFQCFDGNNFNTLDAGVGINYQYVWQPSGNTDRQLSISSAGKYAIKVTNQEGCISEKNIEVIAECKPYLFVPEIFTPNEDGLNDQLKIVIDNYTFFEMRVFSRNGELLFLSNDPQKTWDGTFLHQPCTQGTYAYHIDYVWGKEPNQIIGKNGVILLER